MQQLNRRRLFACLAVAPVAAVLPVTDESRGWLRFNAGMRAALREWQARGGLLFTPGCLAGLFIPPVIGS